MITVEPRTVGERLRDIRGLATHPGWTEHMDPMLDALEREQTEHAINPTSTPQQRAEHVQAIHILRKLRAFPKDREHELEASWKLQQKKRPTA